MWAESVQQRIERQSRANEGRLKCLTEDYEALSKRMTYAENAASKNAMRRHLASLLEEIEQVENHQKRLYDKLKSLDIGFQKTPEIVRELSSQPLEPGGSESLKPSIHRTVISQTELLAPKTHPYEEKARRFNFPRLPATAWEYMLAGCITVILVVGWAQLGVSGSNVPDHNSSFMAGDIRQRFALMGGTGGLMAGLFLSFFAMGKNYLRQRSEIFSLSKLLIHCGLFALAGSLAWFLSELIVHSKNNLDLYGEGAIHGALICIFLSLCVLWLPLSVSIFRNR